MDITPSLSVFGRSSVAEFLGDFLVYRNLIPMDTRLPGLNAIRKQAGLPAGPVPRKVQPDYARVIVEILKRARAMDAPGTELKRLIFVGDTRMNDGTAFTNICRAGSWPGFAFIASETSKPPSTEIMPVGSEHSLYLANRWTALADFDHYLVQEKFPLDSSTAVIVDLDKTALGARGRNAHVIDQARVQAVQDTVASLLGDGFNETAFKAAYEKLNQVEFHPFTGDNQDYLAYVCLILGSGLYDLESVVAEVRSARLSSFEGFIQRVEDQVNALPRPLAEIHGEIYANVEAGDPTPFKAFRRNEYLQTVGRMGWLEDEASAAELLAGEIVITQEVRVMAGEWRQRGAILFGLSDKPDEASIPTAELASQGYLPIHRTSTHAVGQVEALHRK
jgi:hypothetical protein